MTGTPLGPVSTRKESCPSQQSSILVVRSSAAERSRPTRNITLSRSLRTAGHSDICPSDHLTGDQVHPSGRCECLVATGVIKSVYRPAAGSFSTAQLRASCHPFSARSGHVQLQLVDVCRLEPRSSVPCRVVLQLTSRNPNLPYQLVQ